MPQGDIHTEIQKLIPHAEDSQFPRLFAVARDPEFGGSEKPEAQMSSLELLCVPGYTTTRLEGSFARHAYVIPNNPWPPGS